TKKKGEGEERRGKGGEEKRGKKRERKRKEKKRERGREKEGREKREKTGGRVASCTPEAEGAGVMGKRRGEGRKEESGAGG
uniref:hypothetical protein n=1 Tax=Enterobacter roggenkampii TaxID=1812935 RepID=UPI0019646B25